MTVRAVFFDFGGVLTSSPFEAFAAYERRNGLPDGFIRRLNATDPDTNAWARMERSQISIDEFCTAFEEEARRAGGELDGRAVLEAIKGELRPEMVEAVRRAGERLRTACLTNNFVDSDSPTMSDEAAAVWNLFDAIIESSKAGCRKPDRRFYELACEAVDVEPSSVVFLDDLGINLKPAREMGMTTIKVSDADAAIAELEAVVGFDLS